MAGMPLPDKSDWWLNIKDKANLVQIFEEPILHLCYSNAFYISGFLWGLPPLSLPSILSMQTNAMQYIIESVRDKPPVSKWVKFPPLKMRLDQWTTKREKWHNSIRTGAGVPPCWSRNSCSTDAFGLLRSVLLEKDKPTSNMVWYLLVRSSAWYFSALAENIGKTVNEVFTKKFIFYIPIQVCCALQIL